MKNKVAIIYDFDLTLSNKEMQEFGLFAAIGTDNDSFMQVVRKFAKDNNSDLILSFMLKILEFAKNKRTKLTKELAIKFETDEEIVRLVLVRMGALTRKKDKDIK